ncbi:hypothetical protein ACIOBL_05835 [Paenibacillus taichungensis]|uniref:hypothetical protein n=1 Tax=Paenibacillus taichungensis TaxID=484184 RepID=UPI003810C868
MDIVMPKMRRKRIIRITAIVILLLLITCIAFVYVNDRPGGLADRRMSKAMGMSETMHIPIGKTAEEAIRKFRNNDDSLQIIHQEPVDGGIILFKQKTGQENNSNLQMDYARKIIFGWKWAWGGGYSIGESSQFTSALDYMSIPELSHISTPFPMLFGHILDPAIQRVTVEFEGNEKPVVAEAKLVEVGPESIIWFVSLPSSATIPYEMKGFNDKGELVTHKQMDDPNGMGAMVLGER